MPHNLEGLVAQRSGQIRNVWGSLKKEEFEGAYRAHCEDALKSLKPRLNSGHACLDSTLRAHLALLVNARMMAKAYPAGPTEHVSAETLRALNEVRSDTIKKLELNAEQNQLLAQRLADLAFMRSLPEAEREEMLHLCANSVFDKSLEMQLELALQALRAVEDNPATTAIGCQRSKTQRENLATSLKIAGDLVSITAAANKTAPLETGKEVFNRVVSSRTRAELTEIHQSLKNRPSGRELAAQSLLDASAEALVRFECEDMNNPLPLSSALPEFKPYWAQLKDAVIKRIDTLVTALRNLLHPHSSQHPTSVLDASKSDLTRAYSPFASDTVVVEETITNNPDVIKDVRGSMGIRKWVTTNFNFPGWRDVPDPVKTFAYRTIIKGLDGLVNPSADGYFAKLAYTVATAKSPGSLDTRLDDTFVNDTKRHLLSGNEPSTDARTVIGCRSFELPTNDNSGVYEDKVVLEFASALVGGLKNLRVKPEVVAQFDRKGKLYDKQLFDLLQHASQNKALNPVDSCLCYLGTNQIKGLRFPISFKPPFSSAFTEKREVIYEDKLDGSIDVTFSVQRSKYSHLVTLDGETIEVLDACLGSFATINVSKERGFVLTKHKATGHVILKDGRRIELAFDALLEAEQPENASVPDKAIDAHTRARVFTTQQAEDLRAIIKATHATAKVAETQQNAGAKAIADFRQPNAVTNGVLTDLVTLTGSKELPHGSAGTTMDMAKGITLYRGDIIFNLLDEPGFGRDDFVQFRNLDDLHFIVQFRGGNEIMLANRDEGHGISGKAFRVLIQDGKWRNLRGLFVNALETRTGLEQLDAIETDLKKILGAFPESPAKETALDIYFVTLRNAYPRLNQRCQIGQALTQLQQKYGSEWTKHSEAIQRAAAYIPGLPCDIKALNDKLVNQPEQHTPLSDINVTAPAANTATEPAPGEGLPPRFRAQVLPSVSAGQRFPSRRQVTSPIPSAALGVRIDVASDISTEIEETLDANTEEDAIGVAPLNQGGGSLPERFRAGPLPKVSAK